MPSKQEIEDLLNRIEQSQSFGSSSTYSRLLRFLVACSSNGTVPKEHTLAGHLFGKDTPRSDTSKIRVYVYNLRKKLSTYYEQEGQAEPYHLSIPKGGYKVLFQEKEQAKVRPFNTSFIKIKTYLLPISLGILLGALAVMALFLFPSKKSNKQLFLHSSTWNHFFATDKPIQVIIGDLFIFTEIDTITGEVQNIRIPDINTPAQFEFYQNQRANKDRHLTETNYTHLSKGSSEWIFQLTKIFHPEKDFNIRAYSRIEAKDLHDYNIVFVGMQKTAGLFNGYFEKSAIGFDATNANQYVLKKDTATITYQTSGNPNERHTDYGFIAKYPGPNNNTIFIFSGLWDSATSATLTNFTTTPKLKTMEQYMENEIGYVPKYFEMLLEVNGVDRIGFESKVVHFKALTE